MFAILFLPLVVAVTVNPTATQNYSLKIENGTLKNVRYEGVTLADLDLSGMGIRNIEKNALNSLSELKSLNLAKNSLNSLPGFVFSNLTKLEYLSLAENQISSMKYLLVGLEKLQVLNISKNPIVHLRRGDLFGPTMCASILTDSNVFWSIGTDVFMNVFSKLENVRKEQEEINNEGDEGGEDSESSNEEGEQEEKGKQDVWFDLAKETKSRSVNTLNKGKKIQLCMSDGIVTSLEVLAEEHEILSNCSKLLIDDVEKKVNLSGLHIKGFQEGWYRLGPLPIAVLDLSNNEIHEITRETLNDLPPNLIYVNLIGNRIRRIWKRVIENYRLKILNLKDNLIKEIEGGAFEKTSLRGLILTGNLLEDLSFVATLPETLTEFISSSNQITSFPDGVFSNLIRLVYLNLGNNRIRRLQKNALKGLDSLQVLILTRNNFTQIESGAFKDLKQLRTLYLYHNSLSKFENGTLSDLESLKDLNLAWNKFSKITKDTFADLPKTLDFLHLDFNEIEIIEKRSFINVPRFTLSLNGNKISAIEQGAFDLPTLKDLHLSNNTLISVDGDSFEGLPRLKRLFLSENRISNIQKGACKHLGSLHVLDISKNPFQRLQNGVLYGLSLARGNFLYVYNNQMKEVNTCVFDDV